MRHTAMLCTCSLHTMFIFNIDRSLPIYCSFGWSRNGTGLQLVSLNSHYMRLDSNFHPSEASQHGLPWVGP